MRWLVGFLALLLTTTAFAQPGGVSINPPTSSSPVTPTFSNSTIAVTNTWQTLLTVNLARRACDMQNQGTHVMYFQATTTNVAPTGVGAAKQVQPGQVIACNNYGGGVIQGYIWITGTSGDAYQVTEYQ